MIAKRILIVNVNWLGDVLFSTPFIRALRNNFPDAYIACMIVPRCKEILEGNANLNEIIVYDEKACHSGFLGKIRFIGQLKKYKFDTVFLLHRSFTRTFLTYLAGIRQRIGYYTLKRSFFLTEKPRPEKKILHRAEYYLGLARAVGLKVDDKGCDFFLRPEEISWANDFLKTAGVKNGQKIIIFNPGGNWIPKRWPVENFGELGKKISAHFGETAKILLSGSEKDVKLANSISERIQAGVVITCGKATLRQTAALFKRADLVVSNDSGPLHIAAAVGAKVIGIFGPTSPEITGPYKADVNNVILLHKDIGCKIPCYNMKCSYSRCMAAIKPDEVFEAVIHLMTNDKIQMTN